MRALVPFLPDELLPLVLMAAGLCLLLQLRSLAAALAMTAVAAPFIGVIAGTFLETLPWFVVAAVFVVALLAFGRAVLNGLIGRAATDHVVGDLAGDVVRFLVRLPFVALGLVARAARRLLARRH